MPFAERGVKFCDCGQFWLCRNVPGDPNREACLSELMSVTKPNVMEDDMDDRTNLDDFLERTRVAVQNRRSRKVKKGKY